jgi:hypothetical protein
MSPLLKWAGVYVSWSTTHNYIYIEYHSVCPLVGIGTPPPTPYPANECVLPLETNGWRGGGWYTLACVLEGGGVPIRMTGEKA